MRPVGEQLSPRHGWGRAGVKGQRRLPPAGQFRIDFREKFGIEQGPVLSPPCRINPEPCAKRVKTIWPARIFAARQGKRIDHAIPFYWRNFEKREFRIEKTQIEFGIMRDNSIAAGKLQEALGDPGENRLAREKLGRKPMHPESRLGHVAFWIDIGVKDLAGRYGIEKLDAADLDDPVAACRIKPRRLCIEDNLAQFTSSRQFSRRPAAIAQPCLERGI